MQCLRSEKLNDAGIDGRREGRGARHSGTANENNFVMFKYDGTLTMPGGSINPGVNTATLTGVTSFSDWTLAEPAPAAPASLRRFPA